MSKKRFLIGITDHVEAPAAWEAEAFPEADFVFLSQKHLSPSYREAVNGLLVWHEPINDAFLKQYPQARILVRYGVGFDNVDIGAIHNNQRIFCNTPDYGTEEVADSACALILTLTRKIYFYDRICRLYESGWQDNVLSDNTRSNRTTVGIIGVGRIGTAVINRLKAFGFRILGFDPLQPSGHEKAVGYERCYRLEDLLKSSDVISTHCPDNKTTHGMINKDFLAKMKRGSILINTARGGLHADLDCVYEALQNNHIGAIGLDVLPEEPPLKTHPLIKAWIEEAEWCRGRVVINPHAAFSSREAWREMRYKAAETARLFLVDGVIRNQIQN